MQRNRLKCEVVVVQVSTVSKQRKSPLI